MNVTRWRAWKEQQLIENNNIYIGYYQAADHKNHTQFILSGIIKYSALRQTMFNFTVL